MSREITRKHDGVTFRVESFEIPKPFGKVNENNEVETITKYQAFYGDYAITDIYSNQSETIMTAIAQINKNRERF